MAEHRAIIHVDMDAFFASIAIRDDPSLRGRPVLVGRTSARSVVTAASYEARRFGCRSAMPMTVARRLCPHASVVSVPGERIREASRQIFAIFDRTAPAVEPLSVDEAFLDVTGMERIAGPPAEIARQLKIRIRSETGLTASAGVAPNKFLAKLASDMDKPDGLTLIAPGDVDRVLAPLPVERLWGVGPKTLEKMHALGLRRVSDLRRLGEARLKQHFGSAGEHYHRLAHGIDDRPVVTDHEAKSLGQECTFSEDVAEPAHVREVLLGQVEHVARRLRARDRRARGVSLKIRFGEFQTISRSRALPGATDLTDELWRAAAELFDAWAERAFVPVRLIGVAAERLTDAAGQMDLFPDPHREKRRQLDQALDDIVSRFGERSIHRGTARGRPRPR